MAPHEPRTDDIQVIHQSSNDHSSDGSTASGNSDDERRFDDLYHIRITVSHLNKDVNSTVEKTRITGTYTSLAAAKAAAHRSLYDAGYEREWFPEFDVKSDDVPIHKRRPGLIVYAVAPDKTTFSVSIATTPNIRRYTADENGKVMLDLYHVLQTAVDYSRNENGEDRETNVLGSFESYEEALKYAHQVLLSESDNITKSSFADYQEAAAQEQDCGYDEDVVVRAVGQNGLNFLVSVVKAQELEAVRLAEAARFIR